jgi:hypothetical protein
VRDRVTDLPDDRIDPLLGVRRRLDSGAEKLARFSDRLSTDIGPAKIHANHATLNLHRPDLTGGKRHSTKHVGFWFYSPFRFRMKP